MPRYLFVFPESNHPKGGVNVALQIIDILNKSGYVAGAVFSNPRYKYGYYGYTPPSWCYPPLAQAPGQFKSRKEKLRRAASKLFALRENSLINQALDLQADDVIVIPEFLYPEYSSLFPYNRRILLTQGAFNFLRAYQRDLALEEPWINRFSAICTTSLATNSAVQTFAKKSSYLLKLSVMRDGLDFSPSKHLQIAYMPRRRSVEVGILTDYLKQSPELRHWSFVEISGLSPSGVDKVLRDSLIFLSFSLNEGFGLPPAEAMAAGCIVVGYTGVGGEEFFRDEFAFPIPDGDLVQFASTVENVAAEYEMNPARLDVMRRNASGFIQGRYNKKSMQESVLAAWSELDRELTRT